MIVRHAGFLVALIAFAASTGSALAQGNVLLPNENQDKSNYPNLGLTPPEPPPPPVEIPKPPEPAKPDKAATTSTDTTQKAAAKSQPAPAQLAPQPYVNYTPPAPVQPQPKPYSISISLLRTATWTPADIQNVSSQTGIPAASVTANCHMGINGMLITDRGSEPVDSNITTSVNTPYDGALTNAMLNVYAACNEAPKPAPYNYIQRVGNMFVVSLSSAICQPAVPFKGTMRQILITHSANSSDSCAYVP